MKRYSVGHGMEEFEDNDGVYLKYDEVKSLIDEKILVDWRGECGLSVIYELLEELEKNKLRKELIEKESK